LEGVIGKALTDEDGTPLAKDQDAPWLKDANDILHALLGILNMIQNVDHHHKVKIFIRERQVLQGVVV
jgi:hypothetical protein